MKRMLLIAAVTSLFAFSFPEKSEAGWFPGKNIGRLVVGRRSNAKERNGWYLGKNLFRSNGKACR
jgi:hypothetical protein